jgi:hypothetical protein
MPGLANPAHQQAMDQHLGLVGLDLGALGKMAGFLIWDIYGISMRYLCFFFLISHWILWYMKNIIYLMVRYLWDINEISMVFIWAKYGSFTRK